MRKTASAALGKEVVKIDRIQRRVIAADGTEAGYDRLLLPPLASIILPVRQGLKGSLAIANPDTRP